MASIKERNGKYVVIYSYKDENENRKQKWETYNTKSEAKKRKQEIEYKHADCRAKRTPVPYSADSLRHN